MEPILILLIVASVLFIFELLKAYILPILCRWYLGCRAWQYRRKYNAEVVGEIVGSDQEMRFDFRIFLLTLYNRRHAIEQSRYEAYAPVIRYRVDDCDYEIIVKDYSLYVPVHGRKVRVFYNPDDPYDAYVWLFRKYRKPLRVKQRSANDIYCSCGLRNNIKIPVELTDKEAGPGAVVIEKYGFYPLKDRCDRKPSVWELMKETYLEHLEGE